MHVDGVKRMLTFIVALGFIMSACGDDDTAPDGTATTAPTDDAPFTLVVNPIQFSPVMPGQLFVVLVTVEGGTSPVEVTANVSGAATVEPTLHAVAPGKVAEFTVIPEESGIGSTLALELVAERGSQLRTASMALEVVDWDDMLEPLAGELRDRFVAHIAVNDPGLGITAETVWTPSITKPQILVVMHYLFFSEEWELGIIWHVTVPEYAWSRMYLRPRDGMSPIMGLEIPSYLDPLSTPVPWDPPPEVDR